MGGGGHDRGTRTIVALAGDRVASGYEPIKAKNYGEARIELATCYGLDS